MGTGLYHQRTETISIGFTRTPFCITSKCRWLPVLSPVLPTYPITCPAVTAGEAVTAGQIIGYVGSTGDSTGNHLHFEVMQNGVRMNPLELVFAQ